MDEHSSLMGSSVIPTVRYRDVPAAIDWLQQAFDLHAHRIVRDAMGIPIYGELSFGSGMVMVAPIQASSFGKLMVQPDEIGGAETQICYLLVEDITTHYARAKAAGAEILFDIDSGADGNGYSCRDPEGHIWNVGTYDPWIIEPADAESASAPPKKRALAACFAFALIAAAAAYFHAPVRHAGQLAVNMLSAMPATIDQAQARQQVAINSRDDTSMRDQLAKEQLARLAAERTVDELRAQLTDERRARAVAEAHAKAAPDADTHAALKIAEATAAAARDELTRMRAALQDATDKAADAEKAKEAAERTAKDAGQLAALRRAKQAAEAATKETRTLFLRERSRRMAAQSRLRIARRPPDSSFGYLYDHDDERH